MKQFRMQSTDGRSNLACYVWDEVKEPKAVLQIMHGMCEFIMRYDGFAKFLNENGIVVAGLDHIGHGNSVETAEDLGYFGPKDGWEHLADDQEKFRQLMKESYPEIPYAALGHSMGSFINRVYISKYGDKLDADIIMGTAGKNPAVDVALILTKVLRAFQGERKRSLLINNAAFGQYNDKIENPVNEYAWLTRDDKICEAYAKNPLNTFKFTLAAYQDLFLMLQYINTAKWYDMVPAELPILITSGKEDPVGNYGSGPDEVAKGLHYAGVKDVKSLIYDGMRHEVLNEIGKEQVWSDMKDFILSAVCRK